MKGKTFDGVLKKLQAVVGKQNVLNNRIDLLTYSYAEHLRGINPLAVIFLQNTFQVSQVLKILNQWQIPSIPRGAGTNLCGGTIPLDEAVVLEFARMDQILELDILNRYIAVQPGVTNIAVQKALEPFGYFFAPDPASMQVSTIGGNIAENAGGMRCVKYGVTSENVLGLEMVLSDGQVFLANGPLESAFAYNFTGLMHGSEGTFGVITKAWLRILKAPETVKTLLAVFPTVDHAAATVSQIMARGIIPRTLEMIDQPVIQAVEERFKLGYPAQARAALLIEVDGFTDDLAGEVPSIMAICQKNRAGLIQNAQSEAEKQLLWTGRLAGINCLTTKKPAYAQEDIAVPRAQLPEMLKALEQTACKHFLTIGTVCHAGDGNSHPAIFYDDKDGEESRRVGMAFEEIMKEAIRLGGTITGEHGVGVEKLKGLGLLFSPHELVFMKKVKAAFDPAGLLNPGKALPDHAGDRPAFERKGQKEDRAQFLLELNQLSPVPGYYLAERELIPYGYNGQRPWCVVKIQNVEGLQQVIQLADRFNIPLVPRGQGTKIRETVGNLLCLDLSGLNRILDIDADNLTATVEAGVGLEDLQTILGNQGLLLPVDPLETGTPTMGGIVAANSTGSLRAKYHTLENLVLGIEVVDAEGQIIKYGGKTMKNVAGYDLRKLFIGSWGKMGVITKITLKLYPLPERAVYRTYRAKNFRDFMNFIVQVQKADLSPLSFDLMVQKGKFYSNIGLGGPQQAVDRQREAINQLAEKNGMELVQEMEDTKLRYGKTFFTDYFKPGISQLNQYVIRSRIRFTDIPAWMEDILKMDPEEKVGIYGHISQGIMYATIPHPEPEAAPARSEEILEILKNFSHSFGYGSHTVEGKDLYFWAGGKEFKEQPGENFLWRRLKETLDPKHLFHPDQVPGGIKS
ncbi:FAD-binding oxidoreductase [Candidatus Formimonas warabiya]|uniref:FAD-binding PCMH-type domain-containing protein n=1 Tax=Formimonas warabiya TaxID=1761012 RepID=A0A3G1KV24_FORW1|nr:FAD-binding oxidoreductase [Candidatus Formimonas warabiya]ATW26291.1 hypothetical protein DCMF_17350 [Candidatus Formimonas warabiya]